MAIFVVPSKNIFFMNSSKKYVEPGNGTQAFFNILHMTVLYMFDRTVLKEAGLQGDGPALSVYPNPAAGALHVTCTAPAGEDIFLSLFNLAGQQVRDTRQTATSGVNRMSLDITSVPSGMYLLKAETGDKTTTAKVMIR